MLTVTGHTHYLGVPPDDLDLSTISWEWFAVNKQSILIWWIDLWFYTFAIGLTKMAAIIFCWRIFARSPIGKPLVALGLSTVIWIICRVSFGNTWHYLTDEKLTYTDRVFMPLVHTCHKTVGSEQTR